jgi:hypothetical protein
MIIDLAKQIRSASEDEFTNVELITSTGNFVVPAGITGGGAGDTADNLEFAGGGGGGAARGYISVTPGETISATIGAGGAATPNNYTTAPEAGGTTSFGTYISATGGGAASTSNGGQGGTGSLDDVISGYVRTGQGGQQMAFTSAGTFIQGALGGNSPFVNGCQSIKWDSIAFLNGAANTGAGGSAGANGSGNGATGYIEIKW